MAENASVKSNGIPRYLNHIGAECAANIQNSREANHSFVADGRHFNLWAISNTNQHGHHRVQREVDAVDMGVLYVQLLSVLERNNRSLLAQCAIVVSR